MIRYTSNKQLKIEFFKTPFDVELDRENRWVKLAEIIPWDELAGIYQRKLHRSHGRPSLSPRVAVGSLIIKHIKGLSDELVIEEIKENPYLQYFLGYEDYRVKRVFDPSLFVSIRKRMGFVEFSQFNELLIRRLDEIKKGRPAKKEEKNDDENKPSDGNMGNSVQSGKITEEPSCTADKESTENKGEDSTAPENNGVMIVDATVADQKIKFPNDVDLLNRCREKCEEIIDELYPESGLKKKPRTHRQKARKLFLRISKRKNRSEKIIRKAIKQQLNFVGRDIKIINSLLDRYSEMPLDYVKLKQYWVIQEVLRQQKEMYKENERACGDRIVNIFQPYVRPMLRGKMGRRVEFGAKVNISLTGGMVTVNKISYDAYNESRDLIDQVEQYKRTYGYYPEVVIADQIYGSRENRKWLKDQGIKYSGKPLGRRPKETEENREELKEIDRQLKEYQNQRSEVEGKFGQGKNFYGLNRIAARLKETSISWIMAIFTGMNLIRVLKELKLFIFWLVRKYLWSRTAVEFAAV